MARAPAKPILNSRHGGSRGVRAFPSAPGFVTDPCRRLTKACPFGVEFPRRPTGWGRINGPWHLVSPGVSTPSGPKMEAPPQLISIIPLNKVRARPEKSEVVGGGSVQAESGEKRSVRHASRRMSLICPQVSLPRTKFAKNLCAPFLMRYPAQRRVNFVERARAKSLRRQKRSADLGISLRADGAALIRLVRLKFCFFSTKPPVGSFRKKLKGTATLTARI